MSLRKFCSQGLPDTHPLHCPSSPQCEHHWFYDFRVNRRRYRNTTETANKQTAKAIEAKERARVLDGRHQIRRLPDITFKSFTTTYLRDHAELNKRSAVRDEAIVAVLNRFFGTALLHEITPHRVEQFKRDRRAETWRGHNTRGPAKPIQPGTVNRELDGLKAILAKAVEWGKLRESPAAHVKRLKVDNRRLRILTEAEQVALLQACPSILSRIVRLALITGARIGELLELRWDAVSSTELLFLHTKNGRARRIPVSTAIAAVLAKCSKKHPWVFTNLQTKKPYTVNGVGHTFRRALKRAGILTGDVSPHTLRHTALSRMIAVGIDDHTVMALSGHSSTRMLERYTHPTNARKVDALESFTSAMGRNWAESDADAASRRQTPQIL